MSERQVVWKKRPGSGNVKMRKQNMSSPSPVTDRPGVYVMTGNGKIYVTNEDGLTSVLKAGPKFEALAQNELADYCLSSPAVSDGQIFIRITKYLYCIGKLSSS